MFLSSKVSSGDVPTYVLFVTILVGAFGIQAFGRASEQPKSFALQDGSQAQADTKTLPPLESDRLLAEDRAHGKDQPPRFAVPVDVHFTLENSGTWQTLADSSRIWRLRIYSPGAHSLNLAITRFDMTEGTKLWIYNPSHDEVQGPYTARNRNAVGTLFTPVIRGDEMLVEIFVPAGSAKPAIEIGRVNQGYRGFGKN
jgi:lysyl endopeptidase